MSNALNQVVSIEYRDDKVFLRLADGHEIGNPLIRVKYQLDFYFSNAQPSLK